MIAFLLPAAQRHSRKSRGPEKRAQFSIHFLLYLFFHPFNKYMLMPAIWDTAGISVNKADEIFKVITLQVGGVDNNQIRTDFF